MIHFTLTSKKLLDAKADCYVVFLEQDFTFSKDLEAIEKKYVPNLKSFIKQKEFTGRAKSRLLINACASCTECVAGNEIVHMLLLGLGALGMFRFRRFKS